jgi:hypothetical protein
MNIDKNILEWLDLIPNKIVLWNVLDKKLSDLYNKQTILNSIIIFDIEFLKFLKNKEQLHTIHEMGGIILQKYNNEWYLISIFHLNLKPLSTDLTKLYLLHSDYNSLSDENIKKLIKLEKKLLIHPNLINKENLSNKKIIDIINKKKISKIYNLNINKLIQIKEQDYKKFIKTIKKVVFYLNGNDLQNHPKEFNLFKKMMNIVLNDKESNNRLVKDDSIFINLTNKLFSNSYLIIKGLEDIKSLVIHSKLLNLKPIEFKNYFDISIYNNILHNKCDSAELKKNYDCLEELHLTHDYDGYLEIIKKLTKLKAHNPLVDAYMTWIIYNIFLVKKIT